jgi:hypothetical protein
MDEEAKEKSVEELIEMNENLDRDEEWVAESMGEGKYDQ